MLVSFLVGQRGPGECYAFMQDVASRLVSRVQLTTDGLRWYVDAVDRTFGIDVDFAQIQKHYKWQHSEQFGGDSLQPRPIPERHEGGHKRQP